MSSTSLFRHLSFEFWHFFSLLIWFAGNASISILTGSYISSFITCYWSWHYVFQVLSPPLGCVGISVSVLLSSYLSNLFPSSNLLPPFYLLLPSSYSFGWLTKNYFWHNLYVRFRCLRSERQTVVYGKKVAPCQEPRNGTSKPRMNATGVLFTV